MGIAVAVSIYLVVKALLEDPGAGECGTGAWSVMVLWLFGHSTGGQSLMKVKQTPIYEVSASCSA